MIGLQELLVPFIAFALPMAAAARALRRQRTTRTDAPAFWYSFVTTPTVASCIG
jgi:hypothetical protein